MLKAAKAQEKVLKYVRDELDCQEREDVRDVLHKYRTWTAGQWRQTGHGHDGQRDSFAIAMPGRAGMVEVFYREIAFEDVRVKDWQKSLSPFMAYPPEECRLRLRRERCSVTDAKSHSHQGRHHKKERSVALSHAGALRIEGADEEAGLQREPSSNEEGQR